MADLDSYVGRVTYCLGLLALAEGVTRISQDELSTRIEQLVGARYGQPTIARWLKRWPKDESDMLALARVLKADPGWLYFGPSNTTAVGPARDPISPAARLALEEHNKDLRRRRA